jgi:Bifunctional DNA primase/polymerase, N-terminal/AAA domain
MRDHALAYAARGFRVFPCIPGTKEPRVKAFYDVATADPQAVHDMWSDPVTGWALPHNIGVDCTGMIVVDIDMKAGKDGMASYLALDLPLDTLTVRSPSGGRHAYFAGPSKSLSVGKLGEGLDIRSHHGYVLAPGSVLDPALPKNKGVGGTYTIDNDVPLAEAPASLIAKLDEPRERSGPAAATDLDSEFALARAAKYLETEAPAAVEGAGGDMTTFRVAAITKDMGLSADKVFELMAEHWNERCAPAWELDELRQKVDNAYHYALSAAGGQSPAVDLAGVEPDPPRYITPERADRRWQQHGDMLNLDATWLFYELLPQTGVGVLSGPSQGGKTFVLMHLARALATGKGFFGIEPDDRGGSILLTGEGRRSVLARMEALGEDKRLPIISGDITNLSAAGALDALAVDLRAKIAQMEQDFGMPVRMVAIDTLSASGLLRDENDNSEAGVAMKALSKLSEMLNVFLLVTHHPPKDGRGQRGAGAIFNDVDVVVEIIREKSNSIRELQITKARDAQQRSLGVFTLIPKELGRDSRGRTVTSCYVSDAPPSQRDLTSTPKHVELMLQCIEWAMVDEGEEIEGRPCVDVDVVKGVFKERYDGSKDVSNFRKKWDQTIGWSIESGAVAMVPFGGRRYLALPSFT